jgi:hypothetical protein
MAFTYQPFEDNLEPEPDISAYDPFAPRSSGALPEGFPASYDFEGLIDDFNKAPFNIAAQRPIRDIQVRTGKAIRRGQSLGAVGGNKTLLLAGALIAGYFLFFKKKK